MVSCFVGAYVPLDPTGGNYAPYFSANSTSLSRSAHRVTVAKRKHDNCLASQNLRDGMKERCYEAILQKHLSDDEYQAAIARERLTKLQHPKLRARVMERLGTLERPKLLGNALRLMRRVRRMGSPPQTNTEMDPCTAAFLNELERVDYGLISRAPNSFTTRSVTKTTRRPSK